VNAIVSIISDHIDNILAGVLGIPTSGGGASGGEEDGTNFTIWQDTSANVLQNGALGSSYRGTIWTGLAGADRRVGDNFIVGAVLGGEGGSFDLTSSGSKRSGTGISVTPYAAYIINDWSAADLEVSYAFLDNNVTVPQGSASVTNHYMANRIFVAGNVAAFHNIDAFTLRAKFGLLWADDSGPEYRDANDTLVVPTHGSAKFGLQYDAGVRYKTEGGSSFGLQVGGETLRAHQSSFIAGVFARVPL